MHIEFIQIAYCVSVPLLLVVSFAGNASVKNISLNILAVSNILMIAFSFFLSRQLIGLYQLGKQFLPEEKNHYDFLNRQTLIWALIIALPFGFLWRSVRKNRLISCLLLVLLYYSFPLSSWNTFDLDIKATEYLCLLCSVYALFWLLNYLPFQSKNT